MTEAEWTRSTNPLPMLNFLQHMGNDRKMRLFACACCRRIWDRFPDPCNRDLVAAVEDHPDGSFDDPDLEAAIVASSRREHEFGDEPAFWVAKYLGRGFYKMTAAASALVVAIKVLAITDPETERELQAALLRDLFGPLPFRPVILPTSVRTWNGGTAARLAQAAYDNRQLPAGTLEQERLMVLADALEEAGARDQEVLQHLREQKAHWRGCWVVDLLLGKE